MYSLVLTRRRRQGWVWLCGLPVTPSLLTNGLDRRRYTYSVSLQLDRPGWVNIQGRPFHLWGEREQGLGGRERRGGNWQERREGKLWLGYKVNKLMKNKTTNKTKDKNVPHITEQGGGRCWPKYLWAGLAFFPLLYREKNWNRGKAGHSQSHGLHMRKSAKLLIPIMFYGSLFFICF